LLYLITFVVLEAHIWDIPRSRDASMDMAKK
jgi:hypothetical protein